MTAPYASADTPLKANRRRRPRQALKESARLSFGGKVFGQVILTDCSDTGLSVYSTEWAAVGEQVLVKWQHGYFVGKVRSCLRLGRACRLGIELEDLTAHRVLMQELRLVADDNIDCGLVRRF